MGGAKNFPASTVAAFDNVDIATFSYGKSQVLNSCQATSMLTRTVADVATPKVYRGSPQMGKVIVLRCDMDCRLSKGSVGGHVREVKP